MTQDVAWDHCPEWSLDSGPVLLGGFKLRVAERFEGVDHNDRRNQKHKEDTLTETLPEHRQFLQRISVWQRFFDGVFCSINETGGFFEKPREICAGNRAMLRFLLVTVV
ncbi:MAG: hypothetical protein O3A00_17500 [Planctomycetota bacterium]|nr:hypothetical protein [Planctomycetota bacterium]